jgi:cell shape-determining protein MreC
MMNSYLPNNRERRQRRTLLLITAIIVVLFGIDYLSGGLLRTPLRAVASSIWRAIDNSVLAIEHSGLFARSSTLAHENAALQNQIAELQERLATYQAAEDENQTLRDMAHMATHLPGITARVVSSFKASPYGTFLIGAGSDSGVQKDAAVLSKEGFVIGRVTEVSSTQSLVQEIFSSHAKIEAIVGSTPLNLSGMGGGNAVGEAPRGSVIATGTPVRAPGLGGALVGLVGHTEGDVSNPSVKVYVRTPVNIETLELVYVTSAK